MTVPTTSRNQFMYTTVQDMVYNWYHAMFTCPFDFWVPKPISRDGARDGMTGNIESLMVMGQSLHILDIQSQSDTHPSMHTLRTSPSSSPVMPLFDGITPHCMRLLHGMPQSPLYALPSRISICRSILTNTVSPVTRTPSPSTTVAQSLHMLRYHVIQILDMHAHTYHDVHTVTTIRTDLSRMFDAVMDTTGVMPDAHDLLHRLMQSTSPKLRHAITRYMTPFITYTTQRDTDVVHVTAIGFVCYAFMFLELYVPVMPIDPVETRISKIRVCESNLSLVRSNILVNTEHDFIASGNGSTMSHGTVKDDAIKLDSLDTKHRKWTHKLPVRPTPSQMPQIVHTLHHLVNNVLDFDDIMRLVTRLMNPTSSSSTSTSSFETVTDHVTDHDTLLQEHTIQSTLHTQIQSLTQTYPQYRDILMPITLSIYHLKYGIRLARYTGTLHHRRIITDLITPFTRYISTRDTIYRDTDTMIQKSVGMVRSSDVDVRDMGIRIHITGLLKLGSILHATVSGIHDTVTRIHVIMTSMLGAWIRELRDMAKRDHDADKVYVVKLDDDDTVEDREVRDRFPDFYDEVRGIVDDHHNDSHKHQTTKNETVKDEGKKRVFDASIVSRIVSTYMHVIGLIANPSSASSTTTNQHVSTMISSMRSIMSLIMTKDMMTLVPVDVDTVSRMSVGIMCCDMLRKLNGSPSSTTSSSSNTTSTTLTKEATRLLLVPGDPTYYDFYRDPCHTHTHQIIPLLIRYDTIITHLLTHYTDNINLITLKRLCRGLSECGVGKSLMWWVTGLQHLITKTHEYTAHFPTTIVTIPSQMDETSDTSQGERETMSLKPVIQDIMSLVIVYRKHEIQSWSNVMMGEDLRCRDEVYSDFCTVYTCVMELVSPTNTVDETDEMEKDDKETRLRNLLTYLCDWCTVGGIGQHLPRIQVLKTIRQHLMIMYRIDATSILRTVIRIVTHVINVNSQYTSKIHTHVTKLSDPIRLSITKYSTLCDWKTLTVSALTESARRSHVQVYKMMKQYRDVLGTSLRDVVDGIRKGVPGVTKLCNDFVNISVYYDKYGSGDDGINIICSQLDDMTHTIISRVTDFSQDNTVIQSSMKENPKLVSHHKQIRKKSFTDLMKWLKWVGVNRDGSVGVDMSEYGMMVFDVVDTDTLDRLIRNTSDMSEDQVKRVKGMFERVVEYYYGMMWRMDELRGLKGNVHVDMGSKDVEWSMGSVEYMMGVVCGHLKRMMRGIEIVKKMEVMMKKRVDGKSNKRLVKSNQIQKKLCVVKGVMDQVVMVMMQSKAVMRVLKEDGVSVEEGFIDKYEWMIGKMSEMKGVVDEAYEVVESEMQPIVVEDVIRCEEVRMVVEEVVEGMKRMKEEYPRGWVFIEEVKGILEGEIGKMIEEETVEEEFLDEQEGVNRMLQKRTRVEMEGVMKWMEEESHVMFDEGRLREMESHVMSRMDGWMSDWWKRVVDELVYVKSVSKMVHVMSGVFIGMYKNGYNLPVEESEEEGETVNGMGVGEGSGDRNVSDEIRDDDEMDEMQGESRDNEDQEREDGEGYEFEGEFEGMMEDVSQSESGESRDEDEGESEMGEVEGGEKEGEREGDGEEREDGEGESKKGENEIVAREEEEEEERETEGEVSKDESHDESKDESLDESKDESLEEGEEMEETGETMEETGETDETGEMEETDETMEENKDEEETMEESRDESNDVGETQEETNDDKEEERETPSDPLPQQSRDSLSSGLDPSQEQSIHPSLSTHNQSTQLTPMLSQESRDTQQSLVESSQHSTQSSSIPSNFQQSTQPNHSTNPRRSISHSINNWFNNLSNIHDPSSNPSQSTQQGNALEYIHSDLETIQDSPEDEQEALGPATQEQLDQQKSLQATQESPQDNPQDMQQDTQQESHDPSHEQPQEQPQEQPPQEQLNHDNILPSSSSSNQKPSVDSDSDSDMDLHPSSQPLPQSSQKEHPNPSESQNDPPKEHLEEDPLEESIPEFEPLDYNLIRKQLDQFIANIHDKSAAAEIWKSCVNSTAESARRLAEHLRIILEPTKSSKLRGDYKSGKRLNMRKVISFIASGFKKDRMWLRRTRPGKRNYQILIAVDDSTSMSTNNSNILAFQSLAVVTSAISQIDAGQIAIVKFGTTTSLVHPFDRVFTPESGSTIITSFTFSQPQTNVSHMLQFCQSVLSTSRSPDTDTYQLLVIISDGICDNHPQIHRILSTLSSQSVIPVFIIIDTLGHITSMKSVTVVDGDIKVTEYLNGFPFERRVVVRNVDVLPTVLGDTLRQFFSIVRDS